MTRPATLLALTATAAVLSSCASAGPANTPATTASPAPASAPAPAASSPPAPAPTPPSAGIFTEDQAGRGRMVFRGTCSECHYTSEFRGGEFQYKWGRRTVGDLFKNISQNMPDDAPGSLSQEEYVNVVTYILKLNGFSAGADPLSPEAAAMGTVTLKAPSSSSEGPPNGHDSSAAPR